MLSSTLLGDVIHNCRRNLEYPYACAVVQVVQQLLEEQETINSLETRLAESDDALTAAAEEVAALRQLSGGERPSSSMQSLVEDLHERVRCLRLVPLPLKVVVLQAVVFQRHLLAKKRLPAKFSGHKLRQ